MEEEEGGQEGEDKGKGRGNLAPTVISKSRRLWVLLPLPKNSIPVYALRCRFSALLASVCGSSGFVLSTKCFRVSIKRCLMQIRMLTLAEQYSQGCNFSGKIECGKLSGIFPEKFRKFSVPGEFYLHV